MKQLITFLLFVPIIALAQQRTGPVSRADMEGKRLSSEDDNQGYQTAIDGWVIKRNDTIQLGRGTMPDKAFAFIYQNPAGLGATYYNGNLVKQYLPSMYADKRVIVKDLSSIGTKRTGFTAVVIAGVGLMVRYQIEIENAIEAGELIPPAHFQKSSPQPLNQTVSVADELIKLKQLLDAGALTQDEFNAQKKKLLNQ